MIQSSSPASSSNQSAACFWPSVGMFALLSTLMRMRWKEKDEDENRDGDKGRENKDLDEEEGKKMKGKRQS